MTDDTFTRSHDPTLARCGASVTQLATRRKAEDVLKTITFVFGGTHYGTFPVSAPYTRGKQIVLYVVPAAAVGRDDDFSGPLDCLVTDDVGLAAALDVAR